MKAETPESFSPPVDNRMTSPQVFSNGAQSGTPFPSVYPFLGGGSPGDVHGPTSSVDNAVVRFDGTTGKIIQGSPVTISDSGEMSGVVSINGATVPAEFGDVTGPATATDNAIARYDGNTGKLLQNSVVSVSDTGAISGVTTINGVSPGNVVGPAGATDTAVACYNGPTGKLIRDSQVIVDTANGVIGFTNVNGGLILPNQVAVTDTVFAHWQTDGVAGSIDWSGPWVGPISVPWSIERIGNFVSISIMLGTRPANGIAVAAITNNTPLPPYARPPFATKGGLFGSRNAGAAQEFKIGYWSVSPAGIISLYPEVTDPPTMWSAGGGTTGITTASLEISYRL